MRFQNFFTKGHLLPDLIDWMEKKKASIISTEIWFSSIEKCN